VEDWAKAEPAAMRAPATRATRFIDRTFLLEMAVVAADMNVVPNRLFLTRALVGS
jgi:hypothetical protein